MAYNSTATLGQVASKVSNVRFSNAGEQALVGEQGKTGQILAAGTLKLYEQVEAADVMKANNEYNQRMNELRNKLLENKEGNALENETLFAEGRQKIVDDIIKRGPKTIKTGRGQRAFMTTIDKDWVNQQGAMQKYVLGEAQKYQDTQLFNQLYTGINEVNTNFADDAAVESAVNRGNHFVAVRYFDFGEERIKAEQTKWQAKAYGTQITAALNQSDYAKAEDILKNHGDVLSPEAKLRIEKAIEERKKSDKELTLFNELYQTGDLAAAIEHVNNSEDYDSPTEKMQAEVAVVNYFKAKDKQKRAIADSKYNQYGEQVKTWIAQGVEVDEAIKLAEQASGTDKEALQGMRLAIMDAYGGGGKGLPSGMSVVIGEDIGKGEYKDKSELAMVLRAYGATKAEFNNALKAYDRWKKGEGEYAFDWNKIKEIVMDGSGFKPSNKAEYQQAWNEAVAAGKTFILEETQKSGKPPQYNEIINAARAGMLKNNTGKLYGGNTFKYSKGAMSLAGISEVRQVGSDIYAVEFLDGRPIEAMTGYDLERYLNREE